ncbi:MAG: flippase-like domain-containing protein, partial [Proteobacteria bacterium]|nr:flippase-like domain-containing protein [Pseudomonadota bacterium]
ETPSEAPTRRRGPLALRLLGLALLVVLFLRSADTVRESWAALRALDLWAWAGAFALFAGTLCVTSVRLLGLLRTSGFRAPLAQLCGDSIKGTALSALLVIGAGEVYRIARLQPHVESTAVRSALVLFDRMLGLFVLGAAGVIGLLAFAPEVVRYESSTGWAVGGLGAVVVAGVCAAVALWRRLAGLRERLAPVVTPFADAPWRLLAPVALSLGAFVGWVGSLVLLAWGLGLDVPWVALAYAAPLVTVATLLPISIGGIGVREAGYALLLAPYGVTVGQGIALGVAQYTTFVGISLVGGLLLLGERRATQPSETPN